MSQPQQHLDPEDVLKLFSLYLHEYGEAILSSADHFMNICEMASRQDRLVIPHEHETHEMLNLLNEKKTKQTALLSISNDFLIECGMDPFLILDYHLAGNNHNNHNGNVVRKDNNGETMMTPSSSSSSLSSLSSYTSSSKRHNSTINQLIEKNGGEQWGLIERSLLDRWWERRKKDYNDIIEHVMTTGKSGMCNYL